MLLLLMIIRLFRGPVSERQSFAKFLFLAVPAQFYVDFMTMIIINGRMTKAIEQRL